MQRHTFWRYIARLHTHTHTHKGARACLYASLGERCVCVVVAAAGARSRVPASRVLLHACVRACESRVYTKVGVRGRERGEGRDNNSAAFSGNDPSPSLRPPTPVSCRVPNQPAIYPADSPHPLPPSFLTPRSRLRRSASLSYFFFFFFLFPTFLSFSSALHLSR